MNPNHVPALLTLILLQGCLSVEERYMKQALTIMENNSINRKAIQWRNLLDEVMVRASKDKTVDDRHNTLQYAINRLGDGHSSFATPERIKLFFGSDVQLPDIEHRVVDENIAYLKVPAFIGNDSLCALFATQLQTAIKAYDQQNISRWIVDLRENHGGNMWPMMLGIAPLLGEGIYGYFVDPDSTYLAWKYKGGTVFEGDERQQQIENPYELKTSNIKIAVLIGSQTSSSGEAIALCFKQIGNSRFFGDRTFGLVTSNKKFELSDGTALYLTVSRFCDRNKVIYYRGIEPDELGSLSSTNAAVDWLR